MLTIGQIIDNDSIGTKVRLSDGTLSIVAHGSPLPSIGQAVTLSGFGYCVPLEGTRPHQTVDMATEYSAEEKALISTGKAVPVHGIRLVETGSAGSGVGYIQGENNAVELIGSDPKDEGGLNSEAKETVG